MIGHFKNDISDGRTQPCLFVHHTYLQFFLRLTYIVNTMIVQKSLQWREEPQLTAVEESDSVPMAYRKHMAVKKNEINRIKKIQVRKMCVHLLLYSNDT